MKAHAYAFYVLRRTAKTVWDDGWSDWKAWVFLSVAMLFAGFALANAFSIAIQRRVLLAMYGQNSTMLVWLMISAGLLGLNYYFLIAGRKGWRFDREFQHHSKLARILGGVAVWVSLVAVVIVAFWTASIATKLPEP